MRMQTTRVVAAALLLWSAGALAQTPTPAATPVPEPALELIEEPMVGKMFDTRIYGFIASSFEKVAATPAGIDENGETVMQTNTSEFDVLHFNLMVQGLVAAKY